MDVVFITSTSETHSLPFSVTRKHSGNGEATQPAALLDQQNSLRKPMSSTRLPPLSCFPKLASLLGSTTGIQREFVSWGPRKKDNKVKKMFLVRG